MAIVFVLELVQEPLVTVKVTVLLPALDHVTLCGPAVLAVAGLAPVPKSHE
jgi:hypothetical protein